MKGSSNIKMATSLTLVAAGAIIAFAITAHVAFLNLQVAGWVFILTGVAGAIISRNSWLRRALIVKGAIGAAAAGGTGQRPPPSRRPVPGSHPAAVPDAMPAPARSAWPGSSASSGGSPGRSAKPACSTAWLPSALSAAPP
jgi:hypothetical protein